MIVYGKKFCYLCLYKPCTQCVYKTDFVISTNFKMLKVILFRVFWIKCLLSPYFGDKHGKRMFHGTYFGFITHSIHKIRKSVTFFSVEDLCWSLLNTLKSNLIKKKKNNCWKKIKDQWSMFILSLNWSNPNEVFNFNPIPEEVTKLTNAKITSHAMLNVASATVKPFDLVSRGGRFWPFFFSPTNLMKSPNHLNIQAQPIPLNKKTTTVRQVKKKKKNHNKI